ncbi:MAG: hypothetical protein AAF747_00535 [Planctomycetota bacterium]
MKTDTSTTQAVAARRSLTDLALMVSAIALAAMLAVRAIPVFAASGIASADSTVIDVGTMTMLTVSGGSEDVLVLLDDRTETLRVYQVRNQDSVELHSSQSLPTLFAAARRQAGG